mgnify:CR=1 FL=1
MSDVNPVKQLPILHPFRIGKVRLVAVARCERDDVHLDKLSALRNRPEIEAAGFRLSELVPFERRDYTLESNWKVYVDNYLEGYHVPIAHPGLYRAIDYDRYEVVPRRFHSAQYAPLRSGDATRRMLDYRDEARQVLHTFPETDARRSLEGLLHLTTNTTK